MLLIPFLLANMSIRSGSRYNPCEDIQVDVSELTVDFTATYQQRLPIP